MADDETTPPPPESQALTGAFPARGAPEPASAETGKLKRDPSADPLAPSGPPSAGLLATGAIPLPATEDLDRTRVELPPERASTIDLKPRRRTERRPLDPVAPSRAAEDDPALVATRPPAPPALPAEPSSWPSLLAAVLCLAAVVYLVRYAFPELFQPARREVRITSPDDGWANGPVTIIGTVEATPGPISWRVLEAGVERAKGTTVLGADGSFQAPVGALEEGVHDLTLELSRSDGRLSLTHAVTARVDRAPPRLTLSGPADVAAVGTALRLVLDVSDVSRVQVTCRVDDRLVWKVQVEPGAGKSLEQQVPLDGLAPGEHALKLEAIDATKQQTTVTRTLRVGAAPVPPATEKPPVPVTEKPVPPPPATEKPVVPPPPVERPPLPAIRLGWLAGVIVGPGPIDVAVQGAVTTRYRIDRGEWRDLPVRLDPQMLTDGVHVLEVRARSGGGETREARAFTFDGTPPRLDVSVAATGRSPVELRGRVTDAHDLRLTLAIDGAPPVVIAGLPHRVELRPGRHVLLLAARDGVGNTASETLQVDVVAAPPPPPPPVTEPPPPQDVTGPAVTWVAPGGTVTRERRVEVRLVDRAGVRDERLLVDGRRRRPDERFEQGGATVLRLDLPELTDGDHEVTVEAADGPGNLTRVTRRFRVDTTPPGITVVADAFPLVCRGPFDLTVRIGDAGPVTELLAVVAGRPPVPFAGADLRTARLDLPEGDHEVVLRAADEAGNVTQQRLTVRNLGPEPRPTTEAPPAGARPEVRIPAQSGPQVVIDGALPPGSKAIVIATGALRATVDALPATVTLEHGPQAVQVDVVDAAGRKQSFRGNVSVDARPPRLQRVRVRPLDFRRARVTGDAEDDGGRVTIEVLVNGVVTGRLLPCTVQLAVGENTIVVVARDVWGNEARESSTIDVTGGGAQPPPPATEPPPPGTEAPPPAAVAGPLDATDSGDEREPEALEAFKAGRLDEALTLVNDVIRTVQRDIRSPYVLRARIRLQQADGATRDERRDLLNEAVQDLTRAIANYRDAVRSDHYRLRGDAQEAAGRPQAAAADYRQARQLEAREGLRRR